MVNSKLIFRYFNELSKKQKMQFSQLGELYEIWNEKINLISRKDSQYLYERHILHSLGIAKVIKFKNGTRILDVGTGGGFPGIPLAIMFPDSQFHLIDSIGKKIKVVQDIIDSLGLQNVTTQQIRAENVQGEFDFIVSRAVTRMAQFYSWVIDKISTVSSNNLKNGILYLKGGNLEEEMKELNKPYQTFDLKHYYSEEFFASKKVIFITK